MRQIVLTGLRTMAAREVPDPEIRAPDEVLVRLGAIGVCGSDVHYFATGRIGSQVVAYPFPVGHECAGVVVAVGPAVTRLRAGDAVAIDPAIACGSCDQCRAGREHTCRHLRFLGCPGQLPGCLGELLVMPERCCHQLPPGLDAELGAVSEPLAIGVYAVRRARPDPTAAIGILGFGPIGMSVLLAAQARGIARIAVVEPLPYRRELARAAGATWTCDPGAGDPVAGILAAEPLGLDAVFECCGRQAAVDQACRLLRPGGRLALIGIPPELDAWRLPVDLGRHRELDILNIRRQVGCVGAALDLIAASPPAARRMITHRVALADAPAAFALVEGYRDGVMKAMIHLPG